MLVYLYRESHLQAIFIVRCLIYLFVVEKILSLYGTSTSLLNDCHSISHELYEKHSCHMFPLLFLLDQCRAKCPSILLGSIQSNEGVAE